MSFFAGTRVAKAAGVFIQIPALKWGFYTGNAIAIHPISSAPQPLFAHVPSGL
jgi:hypothetical protein